MIDAASWLASRIEQAPVSLRSRMLEAIAQTSERTVHDALSAAAVICLKEAMREPAQRSSAHHLLAADALLTHACEAAAEAGGETLRQFTDKWNPHYFETLL
ncbi:MAG TPA: hypothetical protein VM100_09115 [Longimicrobiales bacterium]|nr:hypothetical protein [Longimicrobiales bacterium]